jgi:HNH endonuclease
MRLFIGVTDGEWFRYLRERPHLDEVNFWQPSGRTQFRALPPGGVFLFKLHAPDNFIVGGGFFAHFSLLPHRTAWEFFGEANGAGSLIEMARRIEKYRRVPASIAEEYTIGCIMLARPFFFQESDWIPVPEDFARNIVRGKGYGDDSAVGNRLWEEVQLRIHGHVVRERSPRAEMWGEPALVRPRLGQGTFRSLVTDIYSRRCAVTGERALPVLEAAHIKPVAVGGLHELPNGLLLRSDIHRLFDRGYVTVTPELLFRVSKRLKTDFDNGEPYYPLEGALAHVPALTEHRPSREFLEWHGDVVFRP